MVRTEFDTKLLSPFVTFPCERAAFPKKDIIKNITTNTIVPQIRPLVIDVLRENDHISPTTKPITMLYKIEAIICLLINY